MSQKVIIIGLDGGTWNKINPLIEKGKLPLFKKLKEEGAFGNLKSTILPFTGTAWPSLFTGKNAGKHGIFDFGEIKDYEVGYYLSSKNVKAKFLWEYLQENGFKCGLINIPLSSPFRSEIEFGEGDHLRKDWKNFKWPEDTTAGLDSRNPNFEKRMLEILDLRFDQLDYILENKNFDFFAMNIFANDTILHFKWNDEEYIEKSLTKIDKRLKDFKEKLGENTTLFIVSDHGMGKIENFFHTNNWLENQEFVKLKKEAKASKLGKLGLNQKNFTKYIFVPANRFLVKTKLSKFISKKLKTNARKFRSNLASEEGYSFKDLKNKIDWSKTKAYGLGSKGSIFINLKGREKYGSVEEKDYEKVRNEVIESLKEEFKDKEVQVFKREEIYEGPYSKNAADILFIINDGAISAKTNYLFSKEILSSPKESEVQADHQMNGIFIVSGKNITRQGLNASLYDITPTILHMFNIPIPSDFDGQTLTKIFETDSQFDNPVNYEKEKDILKSKIKEIKI